MIVRGVGRALATLALVVMTVGACDDNPLAEDREDAAYFRLNPSSVAVNAGGEVKVDAVLVNKFGGGLNQAVTGTACDNKISAVADTGRSVFEFPERFVITGMTLGTSCLVVRGGGITDTIQVRVVPASLSLAGVDTVPSGVTQTAELRFLNAQGQPVTGFTLSDVTFTTGSSTIGVVDATGAFQARAPGTTTLTATLDPRFGVTRSVSRSVTVVAGPFAGSVAQSSATGGAYVTFTQGAIPFDADTELRITVPTGWTATATPAPSIVSRAQGNTVTAMLPPGLPSGTTLSYNIINLGANQVAVTGTFTTTAAAPATDTWGAAVNLPSTAPTMTVFNDVFGTIPGVDQVAEEWFCFVAARSGAHTVWVGWDDGSDIDVYLTNAAGTAALLARETLANPETGSATLTSGTRYCVLLFVWESAVPNRQIPYRIRIQ